MFAQISVVVISVKHFDNIISNINRGSVAIHTVFNMAPRTEVAGSSTTVCSAEVAGSSTAVNASSDNKGAERRVLFRCRLNQYNPNADNFWDNAYTESIRLNPDFESIGLKNPDFNPDFPLVFSCDMRPECAQEVNRLYGGDYGKKQDGKEYLFRGLIILRKDTLRKDVGGDVVGEEGDGGEEGDIFQEFLIQDPECYNESKAWSRESSFCVNSHT